ncbi:hypothetical protein GGS23DRAFT_536531 [Durotheca rogersii]|uniref:uncharacterized protein n=1 Tax=Durotheca rogersii TaxID=419775 RepID=UPI00221EBA42|nr:uncharacterized protein GGS23DRAFT_536531 [Durotheca rogersii]KAI5863492.1 hypothetical protein GGS23DRAFT_536531 [Durotheca rogersii]
MVNGVGGKSSSEEEALFVLRQNIGLANKNAMAGARVVSGTSKRQSQVLTTASRGRYKGRLGVPQALSDRPGSFCFFSPESSALHLLVAIPGPQTSIWRDWIGEIADLGRGFRLAAMWGSTLPLDRRPYRALCSVCASDPCFVLVWAIRWRGDISLLCVLASFPAETPWECPESLRLGRPPRKRADAHLRAHSSPTRHIGEPQAERGGRGERASQRGRRRLGWRQCGNAGFTSSSYTSRPRDPLGRPRRIPSRGAKGLLGAALGAT